MRLWRDLAVALFSNFQLQHDEMTLLTDKFFRFAIQFATTF